MLAADTEIKFGISGWIRAFGGQRNWHLSAGVNSAISPPR